MNLIFDFCVDLLYKLSSCLHLTYKEINVWIFVIIEPIVLIIMIIYIIKLKKEIKWKKLKE